MIEQEKFHQSLNATPDQEGFLSKIIAFQLSCTILFYSAVYLVSEYFDQNRLDDFMSFKANDDPGFVQPSCFPKPIGIHYFGDFVSVACHSRLPSPYLSTFSSNYFPFAYFIMQPFGFLMKFNFELSVAIFLLTTCCLILIPVWRSSAFIKERASRVTLLISVVIMSYPLFSVIDRGNIQGLVVGFVIISLLFFNQDKKIWSLFFLAAATSLKGYPFIFMIIFLRKREWKYFVSAMFVSFLLTLTSLLTFSGGIHQNARGLFNKVLELSDKGSSMTGYSNSLKAFLDSITTLRIPLLAKVSQSISSHYIFLICGIAALLIFLSLQRKITQLEFVIVGGLFGTFLFDPSPGYVLLLFMVPLAEFLSNNHLYQDRKSRVYVLLICFLLVPKGIPIKTGSGWPRCDYCPSFNSLVNPLIQGLLLFIVVCSFLRKQALQFEPSIPSETDN